MPFTVKTRWTEDPNCVLQVGKYFFGGHISVAVISLTDGPFAHLTVHLPEVEEFPKNFAFVDVNNFPEAEDLIYELGIGKVTQYRACSGFCIYPLYEFDEDEILKYVDEGAE